MSNRLTELDCYDNYQILEEDLQKAIDKLAKFEDFMGKYGIDSVEELENISDNAIVPKFKIGQEVFIVIDKVDKAKIEKIIANISKLDDETFTSYSITDSYGYALRLPEEQIFATREKAEKRLAELKGDTK